MQDVHEESWPQDRAAFEQLVSRHEPAVFRGLARDWLPGQAGADTDALDWLTTLVGNRLVPLSVGLPGDGGFMGTSAVRGGKAIPTTLSGTRPFSQVARAMKRELAASTGHALYVQSVDVRERLPELEPYLKLRLDDCPMTTGHWRAWIGTGAHRVNLHADGDENFFCVLAGRKRFTVLPYDVLPDIYVGPLDGGPYGPPASIVDPLAPDLAAYPRFASAMARARTIDLEVGDVLYLPCHWWHYVESFGLNVSVNYWWSDVHARQRQAANDLFLEALLAVRSMPRHWREFWATVFGQFVFLEQGEPYAHLPAEEQGIAGVATAERIEAIRRQLSDTAGERRTPTATAPIAATADTPANAHTGATADTAAKPDTLRKSSPVAKSDSVATSDTAAATAADAGAGPREPARPRADQQGTPTSLSLADLISPLTPEAFVDRHMLPGLHHASEPNVRLVDALRGIRELTDLATLLPKLDRVQLFGPGGFRSVVPGQAAHDFYKRGDTLYIPRVERAVPGVAELFLPAIAALGVHPGHVTIEMFAGRRGSVSTLHYDHDTNFHIVFAGTKRWTLQANRHIRQPLLSHHFLSTPREEALADRLPLPSTMGDLGEGHEVLMTAGSCLFFPVGYWHQVEMLEDCLAVNLVLKPPRFVDAIGMAMRRTLVGHPALREPALGLLTDQDTALTARAREVLEQAKALYVDAIRQLDVDDLRPLGEQVAMRWCAACARRWCEDHDGQTSLLCPDLSAEPLELDASLVGLMRPLVQFQGSFRLDDLKLLSPATALSSLFAVMLEMKALSYFEEV